MNWPDPRPGLVIRYAYLWVREAAAGREEGAKDRPCAIILSIDQTDDERVVYVVPITHSPPADPKLAVELPAVTKRRLGLDDQRSWIMINEGNRFVWPGPDLRPMPGQGLDSVAYGMLPRPVFEAVRQRFMAFAQDKRIGIVKRTE